MGNLLIVGLVIAWIVVLGPSVFRRRDERGPSSLDAARDRLAAMHVGRRSEYSDARRNVVDGRYPRRGGPSGPRFDESGLGRESQSNPLVSPLLRSRHLQRRVQVLQVLFGSCVLSLALAVGTSDVNVWLLHLGVDAVLVAYIVLLRSVKRRSRSHRLPTRVVGETRVSTSRTRVADAAHVEAYDFATFDTSWGDDASSFEGTVVFDADADADEFRDLDHLALNRGTGTNTVVNSVKRFDRRRAREISEGWSTDRGHDVPRRAVNN